MEIMEVILTLLFLLGVILLIKEFFQFVHKKRSVQSAIKGLNVNINDFRESTLKSLDGYNQAVLNLRRQSEQLEKDCSNALQIADQDVGNILSIASGLIDLNDNLFEKVICIDNCLANDEELSQEAVNKFREILNDDIAKQKEYQARIDQYRLEREQRIQRRILQHDINDLDLER